MTKTWLVWGCGTVLTTAAVVVAGCGQEAAEPPDAEEATAAVGSESVEEVVEEIRVLAAELEALDDQRATVGFLGLADPYEVARSELVSGVEEAVASGDWEPLRGRLTATGLLFDPPTKREGASPLVLVQAERDRLQQYRAKWEAASPLVLVQAARDRFRLERDNLRDRIDPPEQPLEPIFRGHSPRLPSAQGRVNHEPGFHLAVT